MYLVKSISTEEFKSLNSIYFSNILEGLNNYHNLTLNLNVKKNPHKYLSDLLSNIFEINKGNFYIDFYKNNLDEKSIDYIRNKISADNLDYFNTLLTEVNSDTIFYKVLDKKIIPLIAELSSREIFFITYYSTLYPISIWGNYNLQFPCFFNDQATMDFYSHHFS